VIYNPFAGVFRRGGLQILSRAEKVLSDCAHDVSLVPTTGPSTAGAIAGESIAEGAGLVLIAGGDGTVNEALEGMVHSTVPLGILPAGTANVLATELGLGSSLEKAATRIRECTAERISIGRVRCSNGIPRSRYFLLMAGIGLDAHIVYKVSAPIKKKWGKIAYWIAGFSLLGRSLEEFHVESNGRMETCSFALISKVRNYAGDFEIARDASLLDDQFEVVLFSGRSSFRYLKYLAGVAARRLSEMRGVSIYRSGGVTLSAAAGQRVYIQVDGEFAGHLPAAVEIVPEALTLLIPPSYKEKYNPPPAGM
jgi:diacylglycerol kinase (ATP)